MRFGSTIIAAASLALLTSSLPFERPNHNRLQIERRRVPYSVVPVDGGPETTTIVDTAAVVTIYKPITQVMATVTVNHPVSTTATTPTTTTTTTTSSTSRTTSTTTRTTTASQTASSTSSLKTTTTYLRPTIYQSPPPLPPSYIVSASGNSIGYEESSYNTGYSVAKPSASILPIPASNGTFHMPNVVANRFK
ncbi:hypothetical protein AJ80_02619 [Polytolypa hystricis UAMH7299]|uniref:Uncharacterized protein n=1 Tax=Polytolypa hystricis (strain UAMH7299) TaxID=1447883 RepID=A0A2B7YNZ3_POLH7|nr:hypothetical protein AJ80_02619 [Polytolypa hystricis UAMH7299]